MADRIATYETVQRILDFTRTGDLYERLRGDVQALYHLMVTWRATAQRDTPGGSEYMDPEFCARFIAERREAAHGDKLQNVRLLKAMTALLEETEGMVTLETRGLGLARYQALEAYEAATGRKFVPRAEARA